jgi:putative ABC transport system permease protein
MPGRKSVMRGFRSLLWQPDLDDEIADELAFHAEMLARDYAARGLAPAQAALAARRRLGDLGAVQAACRAVGRGRERARRRAVWLREALQDLRLAGRRLGQKPGSWLAVAALAVGLAGVATAWRIARAVAPPVSLAEPASLVRLRQLSPDGAAYAATRDAFGAWKRLCAGCAGLAAYETVEANLDREAGGGQPGVPAKAARPEAVTAAPERVTVARATASLLPLLGVRPWRGRGFTVSEAARGGDHRVAVLSYELWQRLAPVAAGGAVGEVGAVEAGGGGSAAGAAPWGGIVRLDGEPLRIVGVMPAGFAVPGPGPAAMLWTPLAADRPTRLGNDDHHRLAVLARLRPGVTAHRAVAALAGLVTAAGKTAAGTPGWSVGMETPAAAWTTDRWTRRARLLFAAAGLLWLLATASAANLLWAQATARQREIDMRAVLGGGRGRLVRQLLAEGLLVAALGAVAGLLLAGVAATALRQAALDLPPLAALSTLSTFSGVSAVSPLAASRLDLATAAVVLGLAALSCLGCAAGPALQLLRPGLHEVVRQAARLTTRGEHRVGEALLVGQIAVATTLVIAAGLLLLSFHRLARADPGFDADHLLSVRLSLDGKSYPPARRRLFVNRLEDRLGRLPGVAAAGFISTAPLAADLPAEPFAIVPAKSALPAMPARLAMPLPALPAVPSAPSTTAMPTLRVATPGALRALALRRLAGRWLGPGDVDGRLPVAVVDSVLASRAWPGVSPLGRHLGWAAGRRVLSGVGDVEGLRDLVPVAAPGGGLFVP